MEKALLIDTNLLLLMVIGGVEEGRYIEKSKRLGAFCIEDYRILWELAATYKEIGITPYIATEVSNLIDLDDYAGLLAYEVARKLFGFFTEIETSISHDCQGDFFLKFGLTDSSIVNLSKNFDILTNDHRMLGLLYSASPDRILPYVPYKALSR